MAYKSLNAALKAIELSGWGKTLKFSGGAWVVGKKGSAHN